MLGSLVYFSFHVGCWFSSFSRQGLKGGWPDSVCQFWTSLLFFKRPVLLHVSNHRGFEPPVCFSASVCLTSGHHVGNNRALPLQTQMGRAEGPAHLSCANCPCKTTAPCPPDTPRPVCPSCSFHSLLDAFASVGYSATALGFVSSYQGIVAMERAMAPSKQLPDRVYPSSAEVIPCFSAECIHSGAECLAKKKKSFSWCDFFPLHDLCRIAGYSPKTN